MGVDPTTFVTKDAVLRFFVDLQGEEKRRIKGLILQGGGEITKSYDESVLVITDKNAAESDSKIFLPASYIDDSVAYGQQVFQDYALSTTPPTTTTPTTSKPAQSTSSDDKFSGRTHYSQADDNRILAFVNSHPHFSTSGNTLWQEAETAKVTKHTWMSMRTHYLKVLHPKTVNGNKTLQKKSKSFTDNHSDNLYSAFPADKSNTTSATTKSMPTTSKTTTTTTAKTNPIKSLENEDKESDNDKDKQKEEEKDIHNNDESQEAREESESAPSYDFNTSSPSSEPMEELLEHLLTSDDSMKKKKKSSKSAEDKNNTKELDRNNMKNVATPSSTKTPQPKVTNGTQKSNGVAKKTPTQTLASSTPLPPSANHTPSSSTPSSSSLSSSSSQQSSQNSGSSRKPLYSAGKKRAATEQNMRGNAKRIRAHMEQVAQKLGLPQAVVYHAYILHSGDPVKARKYLTSSFKNTEESDPWMPHEDKVLSGSHNSEQLEQLIKRHGKEKCIARTNFLDNSGT